MESVGELLTQPAQVNSDEKRLSAALKRINDAATSNSDPKDVVSAEFQRPTKRIRVKANDSEKERLTTEPLPPTSTTPTTWLITGASRGLGFAFAEFLSKDPSHVVLATCRDLSRADALQALAATRQAERIDIQNRGIVNAGTEGKTELTVQKGAEQEGDTEMKRCGELHILRLDVEDEKSIASAATEAARILGSRGLGLDYLLNNAGVNAGHDQALEFSVSEFLRTMRSNVAGPALVTTAFLPLLRAGSAIDATESKHETGHTGSIFKGPYPTPNDSPGGENGLSLDEEKTTSAKSRRKGRSVIMNMSSTLGSIGSDCGKKMFTYSISKSALNMLTYKQSCEAPDLIPISMCPGWVKTDMGGTDAWIETDESIPRVVALLKNLVPTDAGRFYNYRGVELPW